MAGLPESMADLQQLFQLGQQVQGRLQQLQSELAGRTIETSAGGGMVTVRVSGDLEVKAVTIELGRPVISPLPFAAIPRRRSRFVA